MAKQLDISKANKTQLSEYLTKKLSKDDLQTLAQHVQDGTFNADMLRGAAQGGVQDAAAVQGVGGGAAQPLSPQPQGSDPNFDPSQGGVTAADTTANAAGQQQQ
jgi:hypothetical protein